MALTKIVLDNIPEIGRIAGNINHLKGVALNIMPRTEIMARTAQIRVCHGACEDFYQWGLFRGRNFMASSVLSPFVIGKLKTDDNEDYIGYVRHVPRSKDSHIFEVYAIPNDAIDTFDFYGDSFLGIVDNRMPCEKESEYNKRMLQASSVSR